MSKSLRIERIKKYMHSIKELMAAAVSIVLIAGCSPSRNVDDTVIMKAGRLSYTLGELNKRFSQAAFENEEDEFQQKKDYLEQQLDKMLLADGGLESGYGDSVMLDTAALSTLIGNIVFDREVARKVPDGSNDAEVRNFWNYYGGTIEISQIVTREKKTCDSLYEILESHPERFAELAAAFSIDSTTAAKGGSLGTIRVGTLIPEIEEKAFGLKPNQITRPFETIYGWHIVKMTARNEFSEDDFKAQLNRYRNLYINKSRKIIQNAFYDKLAKEFNLHINQTGLKMLSAKLDSIQRADLQQNMAPRPFLKSSDLNANEAAMPLGVSDVVTLTAGDFLRHFETYRNERGVDLTNQKMVLYVLSNKLAPLLAVAYGRAKGIDKEPEYQRIIDDTKNAQVFRYMQAKIMGSVRVTDDEIRARYKSDSSRYVDDSSGKPVQMTLEQAWTTIQNEILQEKRAQARQNWIDERKRKVEHYIDLELLRANLVTGKKKS